MANTVPLSWERSRNCHLQTTGKPSSSVGNICADHFHMYFSKYTTHVASKMCADRFRRHKKPCWGTRVTSRTFPGRQPTLILTVGNRICPTSYIWRFKYRSEPPQHLSNLDSAEIDEGDFNDRPALTSEKHPPTKRSSQRLNVTQSELEREDMKNIPKSNEFLLNDYRRFICKLR